MNISTTLSDLNKIPNYFCCILFGLDTKSYTLIEYFFSIFCISTIRVLLLLIEIISGYNYKSVIENCHYTLIQNHISILYSFPPSTVEIFKYVLR